MADEQQEGRQPPEQPGRAQARPAADPCPHQQGHQKRRRKPQHEYTGEHRITACPQHDEPHGSHAYRCHGQLQAAQHRIAGIGLGKAPDDEGQQQAEGHGLAEQLGQARSGRHKQHQEKVNQLKI